MTTRKPIMWSQKKCFENFLSQINRIVRVKTGHDDQRELGNKDKKDNGNKMDDKNRNSSRNVEAQRLSAISDASDKASFQDL